MLCHIYDNSFPSQKIKTYVDHYRSQSNISHIKFTSGFAICSQEFGKYESFKSQMRRDHKFHNHNVNTETGIKLTCTVGTCLKECHSKTELKEDLKNQIKSGCIVTCPYEYCSRVYSNASSFTSHITKVHQKKIS